MLRFAFLVLPLLLATSAMAQSYRRPPQDGYWWNPSEGGRGFTIETQGEIVAVTHYVYDTQGRSVFLQTAGTWNAATGELVASLLGFSGGQCIGCAHTSPATSNLGSATLRFSSTTSGEIAYPNGTRVAISRFDFGYPAPEDKLLGTWNTAWYGSIAEFANFIYFSSRCTTCTTPNSAQGALKRTRSGRPVLGGFTSGAYVILIDATTSFYELYYMTAEPDRMSGLACTYQKGSSAPPLTSCTGLLEGTRAHSLVQAQSIFGLSKDLDLSNSPAREAALQDEALAKVKREVANITDQASPEVLQDFANSLQADLEAL